MPIYEYVCDDCQARFERIVLSANGTDAIACPKCASPRHTLQLSVISKPAKSGGDGGPAVPGGGCGCTPASCGCD